MIPQPEQPEARLNNELLSFPLADVADSLELRDTGFAMTEKAKRTLYPIRALRYWWTYHFVRQYEKGQPHPLTILDLGAAHGQARRYHRGARRAYGLPDDPHRWLAFDCLRSSRLAGAGYGSVITCDLNESIPVADQTVDVVLCLHVIEHLESPSQFLKQVERVLKPGGILLAGTPTAPGFVSRLIERRFRRQLRSGARKKGEHVNSLSPRDWKTLIIDSELTMTFIAGTHFMRWSGSALENHRWWARMNLWWGANVPSLGSDLCVRAQKTLRH